MAPAKKKIYVFGCTMWDIVGKPSEPISKGEDCAGWIIERPGGVAFNVALGLAKSLHLSNFEINLVSAIGENDKASTILSILKKNNVNIKYLIVKGRWTDQYLSIETKNGEIFGSINSSNTFLSNETDIIKNFSRICLKHKKANEKAIFIFDGNCTRKFLDHVKKKANGLLFTKYFIPANFLKLTKFKNNAIYFKGFNLIINLEEAKILASKKNLKNAVDASKAIFEQIETKTSLIIVTDGPNIACAISNEGIAKVKPKIIKNNTTKLGAGDNFFSCFLSYKELNPGASLEKSLHEANQQTQERLKADD